MPAPLPPALTITLTWPHRDASGGRGAPGGPAADVVRLELRSESGPVALRHQLGPVIVDEPVAARVSVELPSAAALAHLRLRVLDEADGRPWRPSRAAVRAVTAWPGHRPLALVPEEGPRSTRLLVLSAGSLDALDEPTRPHHSPLRASSPPSGDGPTPPALVRHLRRELARSRGQIQVLAAKVAQRQGPGTGD